MRAVADGVRDLIISKQGYPVMLGCPLVTLFHKRFDPCLTFGVSPSHSEGEQLWALLGSKESQPKGAWCGVKFEPGLDLARLSIMEDIGWFGDFERCVAWAWLSLWESGRCF